VELPDLDGRGPERIVRFDRNGLSPGTTPDVGVDLQAFKSASVEPQSVIAQSGVAVFADVS
jgi:hypothetical protein